MTRIALIHAVQAAVRPVEDAFEVHWPEARRTNLLDDSLTSDREAAGALTPALSRRIASLAAYAADSGAEGVLFTCSAFGGGIEAAARALPIPVLKPNEAMFEAALAIGGRLVMLATFAPAVPSMEEEFRDLLRRGGAAASLETHVVPGARAALVGGDLVAHDRLIAEAASGFGEAGAILLAHFSMATAEKAVRAACRTPVLAAPSSAVAKLRSAVEAAHAAGGHR